MLTPISPASPACDGVIRWCDVAAVAARQIALDELGAGVASEGPSEDDAYPIRSKYSPEGAGFRKPVEVF